MHGPGHRSHAHDPGPFQPRKPVPVPTFLPMPDPRRAFLASRASGRTSKTTDTDAFETDPMKPPSIAAPGELRQTLARGRSGPGRQTPRPGATHKRSPTPSHTTGHPALSVRGAATRSIRLIRGIRAGRQPHNRGSDPRRTPWRRVSRECGTIRAAPVRQRCRSVPGRRPLTVAPLIARKSVDSETPH